MADKSFDPNDETQITDRQRMQPTSTHKEQKPPPAPTAKPTAVRTPTLVETVVTPADEEEHTPPFRPKHRPAMAVLTIYDDGRDDGETFRIRRDLTVIGRSQGDILIPHDDLISGRHAEIRRSDERGTIRFSLADVGSTNGTYVRVHKCSIKDGQQLLIGHSRFRFDAPWPAPPDAAAPERPTADWRQLIASDPMPNLVELSSKGDGRKYALNEENWIGCDPKCTVPMDDPMVGARHARLWRDEKGWRLESHEARDGVWIRIEKPVTVDRKCLFQLGEQRFLLRVL